MIISRKLTTRANFLRLQEHIPLSISQRGWGRILPILLLKLKSLQSLSKGLPWDLYPKWALFQYKPTWDQIQSTHPLSLHINLGKLQPHFTLLQAGHRPLKTYSFGYLLRLYLIQTKRTRRDIKRLTLATAFFRKYYKALFKHRHSTLIINGYQRRYNLFIYSNLVPLAHNLMTQLVFLPKTLRGFFLFRRVKGVKKRIRKRLKKLSKFK